MRDKLTAILMMVLLAAPAGARQAPVSADEWRAFAERLGPNAFVKVRLASGTSVRGHIVLITPASLRLKLKTRERLPDREIPFADITKIELQKEGMSAGKKVAITAAVAGIGVGVILLIFLSWALSGS